MSHYSGSVPDAEPDRAWLTQAACRTNGTDPEAFFPDNNAVGISQPPAPSVSPAPSAGNA